MAWRWRWRWRWRAPLFTATHARPLAGRCLSTQQVIYAGRVLKDDQATLASFLVPVRSGGSGKRCRCVRTAARLATPRGSAAGAAASARTQHAAPHPQTTRRPPSSAPAAALERKAPVGNATPIAETTPHAHTAPSTPIPLPGTTDVAAQGVGGKNKLASPAHSH